MVSLANSQFEESMVSKGEEIFFDIELKDNVDKFAVTLAWTDKAVEPKFDRVLYNDLDLTFESLDSERKWHPLILNSKANTDSLKLGAIQGVDTLNNIEKIVLKSPTNGHYRIKVDGKKLNSSNQSFSIAYSFYSGIEWVYPLEGMTLYDPEEIELLWNSTQKELAGNLEFRYLDGINQNWQTIKRNVDLASGHFLWSFNLPLPYGNYQFRIKSEKIEKVIGRIAVTNTPIIKGEYYCSGSTAISWNKIDGADAYKLYKLNEGKMYEFTETVDTIYRFNAPIDNLSEFYAISPITNGRELKRSSSILIGENVPCYILKFTEEESISTKPRFFINLYSNLDLQFLQLEKRGTSGFEPIKKIRDLQKLNYILDDNFVVPGNNVYRLTFENSFGGTYVSEERTVWVPRDNELRMYPIPVQLGNPVFVVVPSGSHLRFQLFDIQGRFLWEEEQDGATKFIDTSRLKSGIFFVKVYVDNQIYAKKIIVL